MEGEDVNWGRIVMADGKAGEPADRDRLSIRLGGVQVARGGLAVENYDEAPVTAHLKGREIDLEVDQGLADGSATGWAGDLPPGLSPSHAVYPRNTERTRGNERRQPAS